MRPPSRIKSRSHPKNEEVGLTLDRLSGDWQVRYGHPVLVVETFVDPAQFCGTVYSANGWTELGQTDGWGRRRRDYYVKHHQPKRLFCRQLCKNACRSLEAEVLKPALAVVEQKVVPPCTHTTKEIRSMVEHFKAVPDFRPRFESYPLWSLLTFVLLATLCGAPRGQKEAGQVCPRFEPAAAPSPWYSAQRSRQISSSDTADFLSFAPTGRCPQSPTSNPGHSAASARCGTQRPIGRS